VTLPASEDHNLVTDGGGTGAHDLTGTPGFAGGATPTTWAGFRLAPGSAGTLAASDGTDMGISGDGPPISKNPVAMAAGPLRAFRGEQVTFTGTATDPNGDAIAGSAWDVDGDGFDDGTGPELATSFASLGTKTVRWRVTDASGGFSVASTTIDIVNRSPTVDVSALPAPAGRGQAVTFTADARDQDGTIASYEWDTDGDGFDDGTGRTVSVPFDSLGLHNVWVQVTDDNGDTAMNVGEVEVVNRAPAPSIGGPAQRFRGETLTGDPGDPDGNATITKREWDLGEGAGYVTVAGGTSPAFTKLGSRTVKFRVTDDGGEVREATKVVDVLNRAPTVTVSSQPGSAARGEVVTFTAHGQDADGTVTAYKWDVDGDGFDDGTGATKQLAFGQVGTHIVSVQATDNDGGTGTAEKTVTIVAPDTGGGTPPGGGGGTPPGDGGGTPGPTPDTVAPAVTLKPAAAQKLRKVLSKGLRLGLTASEPCTVHLVITVPKGTARKYRLDKRARGPVVVAKLDVTLRAGDSTVAVKLTKRARKALKRAKKVAFSIAASAHDAAGNTTTGSATLVVKK
jgi:hypothetical protein